jgi:hypothetical protein
MAYERRALNSSSAEWHFAHRVISRRRSKSVAFGAERTFNEQRLQNQIYEFTP